MSIKMRGFPFEIRDLVLNSETLNAMLETEQIIAEYNNGTRTPKSFSNAHEIFSAMDLEDEAGGESE